jgi:hypothetical protein
VAQLLGHATHSVTFDTYGDWIEEDKTRRFPGGGAALLVLPAMALGLHPQTALRHAQRGSGQYGAYVADRRAADAE